MKKQLLILILIFLTTNIFAAAPSISNSWKDVTNISHNQCMSKAEKAARYSGYKGQFTLQKNNSVFQITGEYQILIRCGTIKDGGKFAFFVVSGPKLSQAIKIRKKVVNNFK